MKSSGVPVNLIRSSKYRKKSAAKVASNVEKHSYVFTNSGRPSKRNDGTAVTTLFALALFVIISFSCTLISVLPAALEGKSASAVLPTLLFHIDKTILKLLETYASYIAF